MRMHGSKQCQPRRHTYEAAVWVCCDVALMDLLRPRACCWTGLARIQYYHPRRRRPTLQPSFMQVTPRVETTKQAHLQVPDIQHRMVYPPTHLPCNDVPREGVETVLNTAAVFALRARQRVACAAAGVAVLIRVLVKDVSGALHRGPAFYDAHRRLPLLPVVVIIAKIRSADFGALLPLLIAVTTCAGGSERLVIYCALSMSADIGITRRKGCRAPARICKTAGERGVGDDRGAACRAPYLRLPSLACHTHSLPAHYAHCLLARPRTARTSSATRHFDVSR